MKNNLIVLALSSLFILSAWIFVPEKNEEPFVIEYFEDEVKVIHELQASEEEVQEDVRDESDRILSETVGYFPRMECVEEESERMTEKDEQEASEETGEAVLAEQERVILVSSTESENYTIAAQETWVGPEIPIRETVAYETESPEAAETVAISPVEESGDIDIYGLLKQHLISAGIEWWYPYAVAQMTQESHCNPYAENPNGLDKGLFQYRVTYWQEPESIFDANAQIRRYVREVTARIFSGLSIEEVISRHYTSDYVTEVNHQYVQDVLRWMH